MEFGGYGLVFGPTDDNRSSRDQYLGDLNLYLGNHQVKLGADYLDSKTEAFTYYSGGSRIEIYSDTGVTYYAHFYRRRWGGPDPDLTPVAGSVLRPRTNDFGAYLQDSWKAAPGWTVNLGLRWDQEDIKNSEGVTAIRTTNEWQPRIGVVWDPWKDGTTKIHAFAGRFYYALPTDLAVRSYGNDTLVISYNFDPSPSDVTQDPSVPAFRTPFIGGGKFGTPVDAGLKGIYQDELTSAPNACSTRPDRRNPGHVSNPPQRDRGSLRRG